MSRFKIDQHFGGSLGAVAEFSELLSQEPWKGLLPSKLKKHLTELLPAIQAACQALAPADSAHQDLAATDANLASEPPQVLNELMNDSVND